MAETVTGAEAASGLGTPARAQASVNLAAIERNCARMRGELAAGVSLCAVVKADGYGHGALPSARAACAGGASWLAVADSREAAELRAGGLRDVPLLVMGPLDSGELREALAAHADVVVWREQHVRMVAEGGGGRVHVKLDSGMGRLGTRDADEATRVLAAAREAPNVTLVGLMTHFATADELDDGGFFEEQLERFERWAGPIKREQPELIVHAANSAAVLRRAEAHFDMVRCGISVYGMDPFNQDPAARGLEPALELSSRVAEVKFCAPGQSAGYGRRFIAARETSIALLPIGYGDGWRRALSGDADVLIAGRRYPLVGTVSMDSVTAELGGTQASELAGERAVLIGSQGSERITAEEVAARMRTINYEVSCGLTPRVRRSYHRDGAPVGGPAADPAEPVAP